MSGKNSTLIRRYSELFPKIMRRPVVRNLKARFSEASSKDARKLREEMQEALSRPSAAQRGIMGKISDLQMAAEMKSQKES